MKKILWGGLLILFLFSACSTVVKAELGEPVRYETKSGEILSVRYGKVDIENSQSLDFVTIKIPEVPELTLPQIMSASGAKYSDDRTFIWWTKGETGTLYRIAEGGEWGILYRDCQPVRSEP